MSKLKNNMTPEEYMALRRHGPDAVLEFRCSRCFRCCRNQNSGMILMPHDLWRIAEYLSCPPERVFQRYCRQDVGDSSLMPLVLADTAFGDCAFLRNKKCILGDAMPGACRFNPLARFIDLDGRIDYVDLGRTCGSKSRVMRIRDWVGNIASANNEEIARVTSAFSQRMSFLLTSDPDPFVVENLPMLQEMILRALYLDMKHDEPFLPQLEEAVDRVEDTLFQQFSLAMPDLNELQQYGRREGIYPSPPRIYE